MRTKERRVKNGEQRMNEDGCPDSRSVRARQKFARVNFYAYIMPSCF